MVRHLALLAALTAACAPAEQPAPPPLRLTVADPGIRTPESVLYDAAADVYLVSNINGAPAARDNNGFISHVGPDGAVHALQWISGGAGGVTLHAPKGMGLVGDTLFVSDIDAVRLFHRTTGAPLGSRTIRGASFLNDIAVGPDGTVYVTDTGVHPDFSDAGTAAVYRFGPGGRATPVARGASLGGPNGLVVDSAGITVVTFGSGEVYRLDPATGARTDLPKPPAGQLDGIERLADGSYLISSWAGRAVYRLAEGAYTVAIDSIPSPADIGYDPTRTAVLVPVFTENRVEIRGLP